jgi:hypothetical protein
MTCRTDADHQACVRDPAIELLLSHTATLTDEKVQPPTCVPTTRRDVSCTPDSAIRHRAPRHRRCARGRLRWILRARTDWRSRCSGWQRHSRSAGTGRRFGRWPACSSSGAEEPTAEGIDSLTGHRGHSDRWATSPVPDLSGWSPGTPLRSTLRIRQAIAARSGHSVPIVPPSGGAR